jgi:hypothetical protein
MKNQTKEIENKALKGIDLEKGFLTESEVNLLKRRLNHVKGAMTYHAIEISEIPFPDNGEGFKLSPEQTQKGLTWLKDQWKTPRGIERINNPFGYREENIIENFAEFRLIDFYNSANYYQNQIGIRSYIPLYRVIAKDGSTFEYYYNAGKISIVG